MTAPGRHRHCGPARPGPARGRLGQDVAQVGVGAAVADARDFAQFFGPQERDQGIDDADIEFGVRGQFRQAQLAALEQDLAQQFGQEQERQAGLVDRARRA